MLQSGPSSLGAADRLGRALGWFSIGLGVTELLAPRRITRALGMEGHEGLVRAYGAREIGSGMLSLSVDKDAGLWSRVAGDGLDIVTLLTALRPGNPKRGNVGLALMMVPGITALDVFGAAAVTARHSRRNAPTPNYRDRSGFPRGWRRPAAPPAMPAERRHSRTRSFVTPPANPVGDGLATQARPSPPDRLGLAPPLADVIQAPRPQGRFFNLVPGSGHRRCIQSRDPDRRKRLRPIRVIILNASRRRVLATFKTSRSVGFRPGWPLDASRHPDADSGGTGPGGTQ